jgi:hypothetical protein
MATTIPAATRRTILCISLWQVRRSGTSSVWQPVLNDNLCTRLRIIAQPVTCRRSSGVSDIGDLKKIAFFRTFSNTFFNFSSFGM